MRVWPLDADAPGRPPDMATSAARAQVGDAVVPHQAGRRFRSPRAPRSWWMMAGADQRQGAGRLVGGGGDGQVGAPRQEGLPHSPSIRHRVRPKAPGQTVRAEPSWEVAAVGAQPAEGGRPRAHRPWPAPAPHLQASSAPAAWAFDKHDSSRARPASARPGRSADGRPSPSRRGCAPPPPHRPMLTKCSSPPNVPGRRGWPMAFLVRVRKMRSEVRPKWGSRPFSVTKRSSPPLAGNR